MEAWETLACQGGVREDVGKEGMGLVVICGILQNLLFVFLKSIHSYSLRRQVFEHILLHYTQKMLCSRHSPFTSFRYIYIFDTCNFKEFIFYSVSYKELLKDLKLENNKMKFEF